VHPLFDSCVLKSTRATEDTHSDTTTNNNAYRGFDHMTTCLGSKLFTYHRDLLFLTKRLSTLCISKLYDDLANSVEYFKQCPHHFCHGGRHMCKWISFRPGPFVMLG
jgi:hypothetical protein